MAATISKTEYLKRYMSKDELAKEERKKKKKKIKPSKDSKLRIIDDDLDFRKHKPGEAAVIDEFNDEAPTVAEVIDERPKHVQQLEAYRKNSRWKILGGKNEDDIYGLEYGVISEKQPGVHGSDSGRYKISKERQQHDDDEDTDSSPPRKKSVPGKNNSKDTERRLQRHDSDSENGSTNPRQSRKTYSDSDNSPPRQRAPGPGGRHDSDSDNSPPRQRAPRPGARHDSDSDNSPPRQRAPRPGARHGSDSDNSPPRQRAPRPGARHDSDSSSREPPARSQNQNLVKSKPQKPSKLQSKSSNISDSDNSPPRKSGLRRDSKSPQQKDKHRASDSDQSPPRKQAADVDSSPPRRRRHDSDQSPPRKKQPKSESAKSVGDSRDRRTASPADSMRSSSSRHSRFDSDRQDEGQRKAAKTLSGAKAGLSSAKEMKEEARKLHEKEERMFQKIGEEELGRNAKTVVRDKETGKKRDMKAEEAKNEEEAKKKEEQLKKYQQWGKGVKQQAMKDLRLQEQVLEASKPLARFKDDKDLDEMLRQEERLEDPMLEFIRTKRKKEEQKSGKKKQKELPRYKGPQPPPNRYNIMPGYRWDGVDRSNGFEKKIFAKMADRKAVQELAYKWSTEEM